MSVSPVPDKIKKKQKLKKGRKGSVSAELDSEQEIEETLLEKDLIYYNDCLKHFFDTQESNYELIQDEGLNSSNPAKMKKLLA